MSDRLFIAACIFLCAVCIPASAQEPQQANPQDSLTFSQARAAGLKQSKYLSELPIKVNAAQRTPEARMAEFTTEIQPVLEQACVHCHGQDTQEGNLRIDTLNPNLVSGDDVTWWLEVQAVLNNGEMPPPDSDDLSDNDLSDNDRSKVVEWLSNEIQIASTVRRATSGHSSFRRLTRYEYNYAMQDMLGLPQDFANDLPPEAHSVDGFQNSSEMLHMSVTQLETYRELARNALRQATVRGKQPAVIRWGIAMEEAATTEFKDQTKKLNDVKNEFKDKPEKQQQQVEQMVASFSKPHRRTYFQNLVSGRTAEAKWAYSKAKYAFAPVDAKPQVPATFDHVAVIPSGRNQYLTVELGDTIPNEGIMRVRVRAARTSSEDDRIPSLQLHFGFQASNEGKAVMQISDKDTPITATTDSPKIYQWDVTLSEIYPRNTFRGSSKMGGMPSPSEFIRLVNSSVPQGGHGDIQIDYVEVSAPVYSEWPPASHRRIFNQTVDSENETDPAKQILTTFMTRAYRRSPSLKEVDRKVRLFQAVRTEGHSFEDAVIEVLATILSSPNFLYAINGNEATDTQQGNHEETAITDHELATRLSLFLWSSIPDQQLLDLATDGQLADRQVLTSQVQRMLADPRSQRFAQHFVHQWLDMQLLDFLQVPRKADPALKESMQQEPIEYFKHVLQNNQSVLNFIHSDHAVVNETLAHHYGIANVRGNYFRPVQLNEQHRRGGLLTQAGLLTMNADGQDSHPLKRGVWLLESLLNDPPPPPPPAVPEIDLADPAIAKMTLKQRIEDHRNHPACMSCHSKIDPWGIAFENYDAQGLYRSTINGQPVDAASLLFNDQELNGMDGLKRFLLKNRQDQFVRAIVYKLATYSLGRPLTFNDHAKIDHITAEVRKQGDGLSTIISCLVVSDLFLSR